MAAKYDFGSKTHRPLDPDNPPDGWYHISKVIQITTFEGLVDTLKKRNADFWTDERIDEVLPFFERSLNSVVADQIAETADDAEFAEGLHG